MQQREMYMSLISKISTVNRQFAEGHYELSQLLNALMENELWKLHPNGYTSIRIYCKEQLPFSYSTVQKYRQLYEGFKRLKYSKKEAIQLMTQCSWNLLAQEIPYMEKKLSLRSINQLFKDRDLVYQLGICLSSSERKELLGRLERDYGLVISENGHNVNLSESIMRMSRNKKVVKKKLAAVA